VLRISDGYRKDELLRMAILTRKYYEQHGLFNPRFRNVYSDTDFTFRSAKNGAIVDARDISIVHHHPFFEDRPLDATYQRGNDPAEYERAKAIFEELHAK
jgi:GT2 family glycosyltransferase